MHKKQCSTSIHPPQYLISWRHECQVYFRVQKYVHDEIKDVGCFCELSSELKGAEQQERKKESVIFDIMIMLQKRNHDNAAAAWRGHSLISAFSLHYIAFKKLEI